MPKTFFIYYLKDPRYLSPRYVGYTHDLQQRYRGHLKPVSLKAVTYKNNWLKSILSLNIKPEIEIIEEVDASLVCEREQYWIRRLKDKGYALTNGTAGGDGMLNPTMDVRKKMSETAKRLGIKPPSREGIKHTPETRSKMSKSSMGVNTWMKNKTKDELLDTFGLTPFKKGMVPWNKGGKMPAASVKKKADNSRKMSPEQADEIRKRYATGNFSQRYLADEYGVTSGTIFNIIKRRHGY